MKKVFFALLVVATIASCSDNKSETTLPKMYYAGSDTTITDSCQNFQLNYWSGVNSCGKYFSGKSWKPNGYNMINHTFTKQGSEVSQDSLKNILLISSPSSNDVPLLWWSSGMVDFLKWIFAIILVALLLWFLWWLFHQRPNRTNNHSVAESGTPPVNTNPAQPSVAEIAALTSLVNAVGTGGGGSVAMNGLSIQINGVQAPLIHIENTGNASKSGDVYLNIGDNIENPVKEEQKSS